MTESECRDMVITLDDGNAAVWIPKDSLPHRGIWDANTEACLKHIEESYADRIKLKKHGFSYIRKILIHGGMGYGKTFTAYRLAWNTGLSIVKVWCDPVRAIRPESILAAARAYSPCLLLLEGAPSWIGHVVERYDDQGLLIVTTHQDQTLSCQFDLMIHLSKPNKQNIEKMIQMILSSSKVNSSIQWNKIATRLNGYSSGMVYKIMQHAMRLAIMKNNGILTHKHINEAMTRWKK